MATCVQQYMDTARNLNASSYNSVSLSVCPCRVCHRKSALFIQSWVLDWPLTTLFILFITAGSAIMCEL